MYDVFHFTIDNWQVKSNMWPVNIYPMQNEKDRFHKNLQLWNVLVDFKLSYYWT